MAALDKFRCMFSDFTMYNLVVLLLVLATYGWTDALFFASGECEVLVKTNCLGY